MGRLLFALFLLVPLIEIGLFIAIGGAIGLWPTLLGVVVTALIGSAILRVQGFSLIIDIRRRIEAGSLPAQQIVEGVMMAIAGALLLTPGYFTDAAGFLLLVPPFRVLVYGWLKTRVTFAGGMTSGGPPPQRPDTIDLDDEDWRGN